MFTRTIAVLDKIVYASRRKDRLFIVIFCEKRKRKSQHKIIFCEKVGKNSQHVEINIFVVCNIENSGSSCNSNCYCSKEMKVPEDN